MNVIGAGEPALPGLSIGHNERVAFGLTIFFIDQEDLYIYETRPGKPDEYRYRDRWEPMQLVREQIAVRGGKDVEITLAYTRHGPVLHEAPAKNLAIGLRAAWLEPGMAPYLGSILSMRAQNWDEFLAAMNRWGLPPENLLYADVDGNIGWKPGGLAPIRPNWDGLLPVPGDGRYEWAGFRDMDALPMEHNPSRGWIATANQMNLPPDYPHALGYEWILPYRYDRIREWLASRLPLTFADMLKLQSDTHSTPARRVLALVEGLESDDPELARALSLLNAWDGDARADSAAAALFEVWAYRHLSRAVMANWTKDKAILEDVLDEAVVYDVFEGSSAEIWLSRLEDPSLPRAARDRTLLESLTAAIGDTHSLLGADWKSSSWGRLHRAELSHPVSALLPEAERARANIGPAARGGSGSTVNATSYTVGDFLQRYGASFRMLLDVGSWDDSVVMNTPGQSGDPSSAHYRDLFEPWARDESFPLLFSRERVLAEARQRLILRPSATHTETAPER